MNKHQKLVQQKFLNDEDVIIARLGKVYAKSAQDITGKIAVLDASIAQLQKAYADVGADGIGDLAAAVLGSKSHFTPAEAKATLQSMIQSKVYQKKYQEALQKEISTIMDKMQIQQFDMVSDYLQECYENGYVGTLFDLHGQGIPLIMPLDQEAMVTAVQLDSKISHGLYNKMGVDVAKLKGRIAANVSRGIATGMSYHEVAQQLNGAMNIGYNNAIRIARTEGHRIQVQSAMNACYDAQDNGADIVKQWDSTLDGRTRHSHAIVDGEIRELDKPFSNGLRFPGDPHGAAGEVINCRCALLQRAKWALDDDELQTLKDRAAFFGLDKADTFDEFKTKYIDAAAQAAQAAPKKTYLTKKKLEQLISDGTTQMDDLKQKFADESGWSFEDADKAISEFEKSAAFEPNGGYFTDGTKLLKSLKKQIDDLQDQMTDWQDKLDKKLAAAEIKKLKKAQIDLQDQLDHFNIKTYSNIWKDDVTTLDWQAKQGSIAAKKKYFEGKIINASSVDEMNKWKALIDDLDDFDQQGKAYFGIQSQLKKTTADLTKLQKGGKLSSLADDAFSQDRKDAAYWFTDKNGSVAGADGVLRDKAGEVWRSATTQEKDSIYEYTRSYHKYNEPLRGIEYGTNKFLGVGNVDLDQVGVHYGGYAPGQIHREIDAITSIIDKSSYDFDIWVQRGCQRRGMDKFFGIDLSDFDLPEAQLAAKLVGTTPTEYAFMSTGVAKGKGLNTSGGILMNIYCPRGTKGMYIEPISAFGQGAGRRWDGISPQSGFGYEAEMLLQRGTKFRVTKVEKSGGTIFVDLEVIEQGVQ